MNLKEHPKYSGYFISEDGEVYRSPIPRDFSMNKVGENGLVKMSVFLRGHPKYPQHQYPSINVSIKTETGKLLKQERVYVHTLVAETFIPNPFEFNEIDHINGIKNDNRVVNLRWISRFENASEPNAKSYKITDTLTGKVWRGYNLREWVTKNHSFIITRVKNKDSDIKGFARALANARSKGTKIWSLIVEFDG